MTAATPDFSAPQHHGTGPQAHEVRAFSAGDVILEEGSTLDQFLVILSGQVEMLYHGRRVRTLHDHDIFGLEQVLLGKSSPVRARALGECRVAYYTSATLRDFLRDNVRMSERLLRSLAQQLLQTTQCCGAAEAEAFTLPDSTLRFYGAGEVIVREGVFDPHFYKLVSCDKGLQVTSHGKTLSLLTTPGSFFGETAALLALPQRATVTSVGQSVVQVLTADQLEVMIREDPASALRMLHDLARRTAELQARLADADA
jgi:CRP-like cAMP-binding protein